MSTAYVEVELHDGDDRRGHDVDLCSPSLSPFTTNTTYYSSPDPALV